MINIQLAQKIATIDKTLKTDNAVLNDWHMKMCEHTEIANIIMRSRPQHTTWTFVYEEAFRMMSAIFVNGLSKMHLNDWNVMSV